MQVPLRMIPAKRIQVHVLLWTVYLIVCCYCKEKLEIDHIFLQEM